MTPRTRLIAEVCRARFGVEVRADEDVERTALRRQWRSVVSLIRVGRGDGTVEMIEKRSRTRFEARFYRFAAASGAAGSGVVPVVHAVEMPAVLPPYLSFCSTVYLERLAVPQRAARVPAVDLARAIAGIAELQGFRMPRARGLTARGVRAFVAAATRDGRASGPAGSPLRRMAWVVPEILGSPAFLGIPLVPCHNDVHGRNYGFRGHDRTRPVLLDWESLALNRAGSDLHHFLKDPAGGAYFDALLAAYGEAMAPRHGVDADRLELAACVYALRRGIARYLDQPGGDERRFGQAIAVFERLERVAGRL